MTERDDFCGYLNRNPMINEWGTEGKWKYKFIQINKIIKNVVCLTLTIWWSRTAGTPCACCSIPVFLHRPTNFWCTLQGFDQTPPPYPPPPQELHLHGSVNTQTIRQLGNGPHTSQPSLTLWKQIKERKRNRRLDFILFLLTFFLHASTLSTWENVYLS